MPKDHWAKARRKDAGKRVRSENRDIAAASRERGRGKPKKKRTRRRNRADAKKTRQAALSLQIMRQASITKMPFGKYKDLAIVEAPRQYLRWLIKQDPLDITDLPAMELRSLIVQFLRYSPQKRATAGQPRYSAGQAHTKGQPIPTVDQMGKTVDAGDCSDAPCPGRGPILPIRLTTDQDGTTLTGERKSDTPPNVTA